MSVFRRRTAPSPASVPSCSCGAPLDLVDMEYGCQLPDEVFALSADEQSARIRGRDRVFVLDGSRGFVRTLLPVRLDRGSVRFGLWLEIPATSATIADAVWDSPAYLNQVFDGTIANALPPWGDSLLGARASARPQTQEELPVVHDGGAVVQSMLDRTWPRADIVAALPDLAHAH